MSTDTLRPFPTAPDFAATDHDRRVFRAGMREAWLDRADQYLQMAQEALGAGNTVGAEAHLLQVGTAVRQSRFYAGNPA